ncbi:hypothetical protein ACFL08_03580 [Patescibacteria group bacterium]
MYWIYLVLFILIIFVPDIIIGDILYVKEEKAEEIAIFVLGFATALIFIYKEKQFKSHSKEKTKIQKEFNDASYDLTSSYSYIGEANRKLDILKNVSLKLIDASSLDSSEIEKVFKDIKVAINVITKTNDFVIGFVNVERKTVKNKFFKSKDYLGEKSFSKKEILNAEKKIIKNDQSIIVFSDRKIGNHKAFVYFRYNGASLPEDTDLVQMLVSQALFLYMVSRR